jgi:hypothetical protein
MGGITEYNLGCIFYRIHMHTAIFKTCQTKERQNTTHFILARLYINSNSLKAAGRELVLMQDPSLVAPGSPKKVDCPDEGPASELVREATTN